MKKPEKGKNGIKLKNLTGGNDIFCGHLDSL